MTYAITDCAIAACQQAPSSYSTLLTLPTARPTPHINYDLKGLPWLTTLPRTPPVPRFHLPPPIQGKRKEDRRSFMVLGSWRLRMLLMFVFHFCCRRLAFYVVVVVFFPSSPSRALLHLSVANCDLARKVNLV